MKQIFTFLAFVISLGAFAQNSNLIIFNNGGQQFFVILNGIKQNAVPKTNVKIEGLAPIAYKVKIIFADGRTGDIDKNIYLDANMEYSAQVVIKNPKKRKLRLFDMVALNTSPYGNGSETVTYRPNDGGSYSDQQGSAQATGMQNNANGQVPTGNVQANGNGNVGNTGTNGMPTGSGNGQNGMAQTNTGNAGTNGTTQMSNGTVQSNVNVNGMPTGSATVTTTGNGQNGTVQTNTGMYGGQPNGNIQMSTGMNGQTGGFQQTVIIGGDTIRTDMGMTGIPLPTGMSGSQTSSSTSSSNSTQTVTTTVNGQTTQVTTNATGNSGTHTHADGTVHDHNHNVVTTTTTANGQTSTHTHSDGTVHDHNHNVVPSGTHTHADGTVHDHNHNPVNIEKGRQPAPLGDGIANPNGTLTCNSAIGNVDYVIAGIKDAKFSSEQMDFVKTQLRSKCINSDQACKIVNAFTFDGDKIAMSKFCYDHMTDKNNASKLLNLFQFSSSKDELKKYFGM